MNIPAIFHKPESNYCFAIGNKVTLRLRFAKGESLTGVYVLYNTKYDIAKVQHKQQLTFRCSDGTFDYYQTTLVLDDLRLAYVFLVEYQGKLGYFCEDGLLDEYDFDYAYFNSFQYAYVNEADSLHNVTWLNNAVFYQIFVERFYNSGVGDKSYVNTRWEEKPTPKSFYGGDLQGICQKLDYVKELGATALYLTPVFCSDSNHKYDIYDYYNVDKQFGSNADLKMLVEECHRLGIKVVLDGVFNHTSEKLPQFQDVLEKGDKSPYFHWFVVDGQNVNSLKNNYCCFANCTYMPKLDTSNLEVQRFVVEVATHWIVNYGIDGWRLDVSDEVSHDMWKVLRKAVKSVKSDAVLIGENWHNSESYLNGDQFDGIMNYAFTKQMMDYFCHGVCACQIADRLNGQLMRYADVINNMMFNLLDSHDTHRFLSLVDGDKDKLLAAIALTVFMQGSCSIYYGTEILMTGGYDPDCRKGFAWDRLKDTQTMEFFNKVKGLLALKGQPALCGGDICINCVDGRLVVERSCDTQKLTLDVDVNGITDADLKEGVLIFEKLFKIY